MGVIKATFSLFVFVFPPTFLHFQKGTRQELQFSGFAALFYSHMSCARWEGRCHRTARTWSGLGSYGFRDTEEEGKWIFAAIYHLDGGRVVRHKVYSWLPQAKSYWTFMHSAEKPSHKFSMQSAMRCIVLAYLRELRDHETEYGSGPSVALPLTLKMRLSRCAACSEGDLAIWFKQAPLLSFAAGGLYVCGSTVGIRVVWYHSNTVATLKLLWLTGRNLKCEISCWISSFSWQPPQDTTEWNENWNLFSPFFVLRLVQR